MGVKSQADNESHSLRFTVLAVLLIANSCDSSVLWFVLFLLRSHGHNSPITHLSIYGAGQSAGVDLGRILVWVQNGSVTKYVWNLNPFSLPRNC